MTTPTLRIAFLTNEFVSEDNSRGGLASYLHRITRALLVAGHTPEVFVSNRPRSEVIDFNGVRVERVPPDEAIWLQLVDRLTRRYFRRPWAGAYGYLSGALGLSRALEARHDTAPFDIVHSTNCGASGLFVRRVDGRRHLLRLSSDRSLWLEVDARPSRPNTRAMEWLERACRRRADVVFAPSRFLAEYCRKSQRDDVRVCYPPAFLETSAGPTALPGGCPDRYLLHFGQIGRRKGSDAVASALPLVQREAPDFRIVWAGVEAWPGDIDRCRRLAAGTFDDLVLYMGALPKGQIYALIQNAIATVLPSRVDNLPNTVIESLVLGTPVIGSAGASIDELVEHGLSGELVPIDDPPSLAAAMLRAWQGRAAWTAGGFVAPAALGALTPQRAVAHLIGLATARDR